MATPYLHHVALLSANIRAAFSLVTDFSVVAAVNESGAIVIPSVDEEDYLIAGGVQGLPYAAELGAAGRRIQVDFPVPCIALLLATTSAHRPALQSLVLGIPAPPPPALAISDAYFTGSSYDVFLTDGSRKTVEPIGMDQSEAQAAMVNDFQRGTLWPLVKFPAVRWKLV